jgi:type I restriction enzyme R subunit
MESYSNNGISTESLHYHAFKPNPDSLINEKIESDYIAITQNPNYHYDPQWSDPAEREAFIRDTELKFLRPYQIRAVAALQDAVKKGQTRFLFEMATGTGKTLLAAAVIKLFMRTGNAKRVLFLVDRLELEDQAKKRFIQFLKNDYTTVVYKENRDDWRKAEIVVTTVQSPCSSNKYRLFSPTDFDLLISDEPTAPSAETAGTFRILHRLQTWLDSHAERLLEEDPIQPRSMSDSREWERRQLLDTYKTFGCESGIPTFRYSLVDGVREGYLLNPVVVDARTEITTELLCRRRLLHHGSKRGR